MKRHTKSQKERIRKYLSKRFLRNLLVSIDTICQDFQGGKQ